MAKGKQKKRKRKIEEGAQPEIITRDEIARIVFDHTEGLVKQADLQPAVDSAVQGKVDTAEHEKLGKAVDGIREDLRRDKELRTDLTKTLVGVEGNVTELRAQLYDSGGSSVLQGFSKRLTGVENIVRGLQAQLEDSDGHSILPGLRQQLERIETSVQDGIPDVDRLRTRLEQHLERQIADRMPRRLAVRMPSRRTTGIGIALAAATLLFFVFGGNRTTTDTSPAPQAQEVVGAPQGPPAGTDTNGGLDWSKLDNLKGKYGVE